MIDENTFRESLTQPIEIESLGFLTREHQKIYIKMKQMYSTFHDLKQVLCRCCGCDICRERRYDPVPPAGDIESKFVFVGRNPGRQEGEHGVPFYPLAEAGKIFNQYLSILGLNREDVYITNSLFCWTLNDRPPLSTERVRCSLWKPLEFSFLKGSTFFFLLGNDAFKQILGLNYSISQNYGHPYCLKTKKGIRYFFPIYHPGYLLRNFFDKDIVRLQLESIRENYIDPCLKVNRHQDREELRYES